MENMTKSEVFAELTRRGIKRVEVEFSGGGDEGGCDGITLFDIAGKETELKEHWGSYGADFNSRKPEKNATADDVLSMALCKPVYDKYYSFAGEFHVHGTVTWDVAAKTCKMNGQESVETYEEFEDEVDS